MVKFIKPISFGCKTQSLIADLTLYCGFHAFSNTTLTSFPPAKETIYSPLYLQWGMHCWNLLAEGKWAVLGSQPGRQWGREDSVARADQVIICKAGTCRELFIIDGLQVCKRLYTTER